MAKQLTQAAKDAILNDPKLYVDICDILEIKPASLPKFIERNSDRLTKYEVVMAIAQSMNIDAGDVLEEANVEQESDAKIS